MGDSDTAGGADRVSDADTVSDADVEIDAVMRAAVVHGCANSAARWPSTPLADEVFEQVVHRALQQRLLGALAEAVLDGSWSVTPAQRARLSVDHTRWSAHALGLERLLVEMAGHFEAAGIEFRVLKGTALAHLVYDDPSWRLGADVDLLVPADHFDAAVDLAEAKLGGERELPELRPGFDREFGKESLVRVGPYELDLHRTFVTGPFGLTIDLDELFDQHTPLTIGGRELRALGSTHLFLHACYNAALGDYPVRWCSIRDLLRCRDHLEVEMVEVLAMAQRWGAVAVVQRAAQLVIEVAGEEVAGSFGELAALDVPRRERWLLGSYLTSARSYSRPLAALAVIPGVSARARYLRAVLAPSETYLRTRGWDRRGHVSRALRRLGRRG